LKVSGVRISTIAHATEDVGKVVVALGQLSGEDNVSSKIEKIRLKGHYGNEITTLVMSLKGANAEHFFHQLWNKLTRIDRLSLIESLETRLDANGRVYLRLDKQAAYGGTFLLAERDAIKIEVSFKNGNASIRDQLMLLRQMLGSEGI
jgi:RNA-binding protein